MNNTKLATIQCNAIAVLAVVVMIGGAPFLRAATHAVPGEERRWALDFRTRLEQPGAARSIEINLTGDWVSTISAVRPGEYDAALQLDNARIRTASSNVPAEQSDAMRRRLARPFWATYRADGSLLSAHFYTDMEPSDRNLLQMIATECQYVQASPDRTSWTVHERDGAGEYLATYSRTNPNLVTKHKVKYLAADGEPGVGAGSVHVEIDQSESRFALGTDGGTVALDARIRVRMGVAIGGSGQLTAVTETHLASLRKRQLPEMIGSLARALPDVVSSPLITHQQDRSQLRARLDGQLLEGRTTQSILEAALVDTGKTKAEDLLSDRLAALFRQRPEAPALALEMLRKSGPRNRITDALGAAGSPAAIEVLGAIAGDRALPRPLRIDALTAFILMQLPRAEAMRTPAALLDDPDAAVASAARIASGALARAGRVTHPKEAGAIDAALVAHYRKAQDSAALTELLAAMGNSTGDLAMPVIESALRDQRDAVRAAAARALRLAAGPEFERLLSATISNDADAGVRAAAIFAVSFRQSIGPDLGDALVRAAKSDPAEHVRTSAIQILRQNPAFTPHLAATLTWIAQHDPKPAVRRLAQEALKGL